MSDGGVEFQRDFYDRHYRARGEILREQLDQPLFADFYGRMAARLLALQEGDLRIDEQACGEGLLGAALMREAGRQGRTVTYSGADVSAAAVELAAEAVPSGTFRTGDAEQAVGALASGSVDLVVAKNLLHHLADPVPLLRGARQALAPGGAVVAIEPTRGSLQAWVFNALAPRRERYWFTRGPAAVSRHFEAAGLRVVAADRFSFLPYELAYATRFAGPRRVLRTDRVAAVATLDDKIAAALPGIANYRIYVGRP